MKSFVTSEKLCSLVFTFAESKVRVAVALSMILNGLVEAVLCSGRDSSILNVSLFLSALKAVLRLNVSANLRKSLMVD